MTEACDRPRSLARAALAGLLATFAMDVAARKVIAPVLGIEPLRPEGLGRWIVHMRHGRFVHTDIGSAPKARHEAAIGVGAHYAIGATLGVGYELVERASSSSRDSLSQALAYGGATTVFSWFLMFPATGQGVLGRRRSPRLAALSLGNHIVYGLALGAASRAGRCGRTPLFATPGDKGRALWG